jgi:hypothetical protein
MGHPVVLLYKAHRFCVLAVIRNESDRQGAGVGVGVVTLESVVIYVQLILFRFVS